MRDIEPSLRLHDVMIVEPQDFGTLRLSRWKNVGPKAPVFGYLVGLRPVLEPWCHDRKLVKPRMLESCSGEDASVDILRSVWVLHGLSKNAPLLPNKLGL